jgi:hypothetical protein
MAADLLARYHQVQLKDLRFVLEFQNANVIVGRHWPVAFKDLEIFWTQRAVTQAFIDIVCAIKTGKSKGIAIRAPMIRILATFFLQKRFKMLSTGMTNIRFVSGTCAT